MMDKPVSFDQVPQIRRIWHNGQWYYSIVDVVAFLVEADSRGAQQYWSNLKNRLIREGTTFDQIEPIAMKTTSGRMRATDSATMEGLLRIIQSIPSPRVEPLKAFLAQVGAERIEEIEQAQNTLDQIRAEYRAKGRDDQWIEERIRNGLVRNDLTEEWKYRGAQEGVQFAILTNEIHEGTFNLTVQAHRQYKQLPGKENLRDHMTRMELVLTSLSEETAIQLHQSRDSQSFDELKRDAADAGRTGGEARKLVEQQLGRSVVSSENFLPPGRRRRQVKGGNNA
jgi:DNA-damage-inducible protein D